MARDLTSKVVITASDRTGGAFSSVAAKLRALTAQARQVRGVTAQVQAVQHARATAQMAERASTAFAMASRFAGPVIGAAAVNGAVKQYAELDRRITRIGITADAGAGEVKGLSDKLYQLGQSVALPTSEITTGLETLVAQGRSLKDSLEFLPSVAKTAAATGASVEDIAKSADGVGSNFKIAAKDMQSAFDIMAAGGKAGQFELKEMARYLPSLGPAAAAAGIKGKEGLSDLVAMLQILRKGSGTSEEAASSASNIFQKLRSEETQKRFKKMGVDLEKGLAKGVKEGKNIITVFEDLVQTATKGDLSKIPQLINDMEFARGIRALMTYRGEWQKLSAQIQRTSAGTVELDLSRVQNDMQAKLDRLAEVVKHRARQIGSIIADIAIPLDDKLKEVLDGRNATANAIDERARYYNADVIAREELRTGSKGTYDPETRRLVDARKEFVQRQLIDAERERLSSGVRRAEGQRAAILADAERQKAGAIPSVRPLIDARTGEKLKPIDAALESARAAQGAFERLTTRIDEIQVRLAEVGKPSDDAKKLAIPNARVAPGAGVGSPATMAFGLNGFRPVAQHWDVGKRVMAPLPPARPGSLPQAPAPTVTEDQLKSLFPGGSIKLDTSDAKELSTKLEGTATVKLDVNVKLDPKLEAKIDQAISASGHLSASGSAAVGSTGKTMPEASGGGGGGGGAH